MTEDETRERILDAATQVFSEQGYSGATTRAIATLAKVNEMTLFRHFWEQEKSLPGHDSAQLGYHGHGEHSARATDRRLPPGF